MKTNEVVCVSWSGETGCIAGVWVSPAGTKTVPWLWCYICGMAMKLSDVPSHFAEHEADGTLTDTPQKVSTEAVAI